MPFKASMIYLVGLIEILICPGITNAAITTSQVGSSQLAERSMDYAALETFQVSTLFNIRYHGPPIIRNTRGRHRIDASPQTADGMIIPEHPPSIATDKP